MLKFQRRCDLPLTAIFIGTCCAAAAGQGTTFTYQGQLKDSGTAVSGAYNMTFRLFDADVAGNQVGLDVALPATAVTSGLFTVPLDFGAVFSNTPLWLEIEVNSSLPAALARGWRNSRIRAPNRATACR